MSSILARTGRHRQRYENNFRLVSGCIPYRLTKEDEDHGSNIESRIEVLMVSSPNRDDLVFPKGGWEDDETDVEAACREALEEAGVKGIPNEKCLGVWVFRSKSKQDLCSGEGGCKGFMFALEVTEELEMWPEQKNRDRKWLTIKDAFRLSRYEWMREALEAFLRRMAEEGKLDTKRDKLEQNSTMTVSEGTDCQVISSNCGVKLGCSQNHGMSNLVHSSPGICVTKDCH